MALMEPKPGDLIEVDRGSYHHWAVYVGDGFVVHLAPNSEAGSSSWCSVRTNKARVRRERLEDMVGRNLWRINNIWEQMTTPRHADIIVRDANALVGKEWYYSVIRWNCEHFVTKLRYGIAFSFQAWFWPLTKLSNGHYSGRISGWRR